MIDDFNIEIIVVGTLLLLGILAIGILFEKYLEHKIEVDEATKKNK